MIFSAADNLPLTLNNVQVPSNQVTTLNANLQSCITVKDVDFTFSPPMPLVGETVTFTGTVGIGDAPISYSWNFGDGGNSADANPSHVYSAAGTFTTTLTVTDNRGATNSKSIVITATSDPSKVARVSAINLSLVAARAGNSARVVVTVTNPTGGNVPGVSVAGRWSGLVTGTATGTTGLSGTVTFTSKATKKHGTITFTVTGVSGSGYTYDPSKSVTSASITN